MRFDLIELLTQLKKGGGKQYFIVSIAKVLTSIISYLCTRFSNVGIFSVSKEVVL